ncbi:N-terminal glutamine amidase-domain-containing protein [Gilbertella persicaria]|uniref:N-terminal glutamine amidase-domain-containing protein n=1 Tax=Gilbertella persicaria TaxID=101096 RepID=UPI00221EAB2D|nr:N-terminal glutamine amidase-domain-containing protein [Gilbertella persicaria]KAI8053159.1 N-terminal glutamine amidase-domain-containing protein [Gilbertella persicaria]
MDILKFTRDTLHYTASYCEENIYKLCQDIQSRKPELLEYFQVVFISNNNRAVPLWQQKVGQEEEHMVIWDYHVILYFEKEGSESLVYDFDTLLPFPAPADMYAMHTFKPNSVFNKKYQHAFRLIPAEVYLQQFQSDRSHMLKNGEYIAKPPSYPAITRGMHNLDSFISMNPSSGHGTVLSNDQFFSKLFNTLD